ncbi:MAG: metallophosphoesterase [Planctomycetes bacterium]|nr:metallophosphoesterase [Planctomycetota bacterium]MCH8121128.1 metallophosphoesterase [Planctomycetota bacterium]
MPQTIIDLLNKGIEAGNADKFRRGNVIHLPAEGSLIITGDIHGHRRNFERIAAFADLANNPDRHIVLQEIIHGGPEDSQGGCLSYQLLFDVVRYKLTFPDRVHIIMGNHDTACISNCDVMKDGKEMNRAMRLALEREFQQAGADVELAIRQFLFSQPLALRCDNRIWVSHSLPSDRSIDKFDPKILDRQLKINDVVRPGSVYLLTWGRKHSQALLDKMAKLFDVDIFILGHQPQEQGRSQAGDNLIIIASNHNHGCLLSTDLTKSYTIEQLIDSTVLLASIL